MAGPAYINESLWPLVVPIASLKPDPSNARKHGDRNLETIAASLNRFGQRSPIVVQREGMVVRDGNGRLAAAKSLGWQSIAAVRRWQTLTGKDATLNGKTWREVAAERGVTVD